MQPAGRLTVPTVGSGVKWLADLLLVDGDPLIIIDLIADPVKNFVVIRKDGKLVKNIVPSCFVVPLSEHLWPVAL